MGASKTHSGNTHSTKTLFFLIGNHFTWKKLEFSGWKNVMSKSERKQIFWTTKRNQKKTFMPLSIDSLTNIASSMDLNRITPAFLCNAIHKDSISPNCPNAISNRRRMCSSDDSPDTSFRCTNSDFEGGHCERLRTIVESLDVEKSHRITSWEEHGKRCNRCWRRRMSLLVPKHTQQPFFPTKPLSQTSQVHEAEFFFAVNARNFQRCNIPQRACRFQHKFVSDIIFVKPFRHIFYAQGGGHFVWETPQTQHFPRMQTNHTISPWRNLKAMMGMFFVPTLTTFLDCNACDNTQWHGLTSKNTQKITFDKAQTNNLNLMKDVVVHNLEVRQHFLVDIVLDQTLFSDYRLLNFSIELPHKKSTWTDWTHNVQTCQTSITFLPVIWFIRFFLFLSETLSIRNTFITLRCANIFRWILCSTTKLSSVCPIVGYWISPLNFRTKNQLQTCQTPITFLPITFFLLLTLSNRYWRLLTPHLLWERI